MGLVIRAEEVSTNSPEQIDYAFGDVGFLECKLVKIELKEGAKPYSCKYNTTNSISNTS